MLIIVRHGRTAANAAGLFLGRADPDLDSEGEAQAESMARWIGPVDRVISSPLMRARRTAEAFGSEIEIDERWIELDYGELDGQPVADVASATWDRWRADPEFAPAGGESFQVLSKRVTAGAEDLMVAARDQNIVVVTHVSPIKAVVSWALGGVSQVAFRTRVGQPSITRIVAGPGGPVLHSFNETPALL